MTIIDAQAHIWGADTPERPWPDHGQSYAHRTEPFGKEALLREMRAAGLGLGGGGTVRASSHDVGNRRAAGVGAYFLARWRACAVCWRASSVERHWRTAVGATWAQ